MPRTILKTLHLVIWSSGRLVIVGSSDQSIDQMTK
jgi:hypothetical protein